MRMLLLVIFAAIGAPGLGQTAVEGTVPRTAAAPADFGVAIDVTEPQPTLEELRWIARPLVLFADTPNDPRFRQQLDLLQERSQELTERDVVLLIDTDPGASGPLRIALRPRGFNLVLIDLDGTVVQRRPSPTTARELINQIDRLPSRRQEIGSRRQ